MNRAELTEIIRNGENSGVEFKRDGVHADSLCKRIIDAMREHNGTEPDLIEEEHRFIVRLWKTPREA